MTSSNSRSTPRRNGRLLRTGIYMAVGMALSQPAFALDTAPEAAPDTQSRQATELDAITVRGMHIPEPMQNTAEVASFVTREDFERTGDSDAAQALVRVSGLSVVGDKYVYVRGLGERYSSALFNGSPLPSPEPMQRVVPLDLFPSEALSSITVQKTYSAKYPGEFGGGVIDLQGVDVPDAPFLKINLGIGGNGETTGGSGLTHNGGGDSDWWGYDDDTRDLPGAIVHSRRAVNAQNFGRQELRDLGSALGNPNLYVLQHKKSVDPDFSFGASAGTGFDIGDSLRLGVTAVANFKNEWRTRSGDQQDGAFTSGGVETYNDYDFTTTRDNARVNGLFGLSLKGERHSVSWSTLYVHDTIKETRSRHGYNFNVGGDVREDGTLWLEREMVNNQLSGESYFGEYDDLKIDWRLNASEATRTTPYETSFRYGDVNGTWTHGSGNNSIRFGAVEDEVAGGGIDFTWRMPVERDLTLSFGAAYSDNDREAVQRTFRFDAPGGLPANNQYQRIDHLLSPYNFQNDLLVLNEITANNNGESAYTATLKTRAAYLQVEGEIAPLWRASLGLRYEDATQAVHPHDIFSGERVGGIYAAAPLENDYLLPALTVTWNFAENQQLRLGASKTIARPQFRELAPQQYTDPDNDRLFFGNPYLIDSELVNLDLRYEWFFGAGEYFTVGAFHKSIDNPVETVVGDFGGNQLYQGFLNAPEATLYGLEIEFKKYFAPELGWLGDGRLYFASNYTWSESEVNASENDTVIPPGFNGQPQSARSFVGDGSRMQGQSDHIANLQFGVESDSADLQATLIANYVSKRISVRGRAGQPDYMEDPGTTLDFVLRKGLDLGYSTFKPSIKLAARNLTNTKHDEFQERGGDRISLYTYKPGISWDLSLTVDF